VRQLRHSVLLVFSLLLVALLGACGGGGEGSGSGAPAGTTTGHNLAHGPGIPNAASVPANHPKSKCAACHTAEDRRDPRWQAKVGQMGHDVAKQLQERTSCTCCHLGEVVGYGEPFEARCLDCHEDIKVTIPKMGQQHCVGCHTLGSGDAQDMVIRAWECLKCHNQNQGNSAAIDVHGGEDCADCHQPHSEPWTKPRECSECHARQEVVKHGKAAEAAVAAGALVCNDCHRPHEQAGAADGRCAECHKQRTPEVFKNTLFKGHDACTNCHAPHDFDKVDAKPCGTCHDKKQTMAGKGAEKHAECKNCHTPHDARGSALSACGKCHDVKSSHPDPKGTGCTTCHNPHPGGGSTGGMASSVVAAAGCTGCHAAVKAQQGKHGDLACNKCHAKHDEGKAVAGCATCHAAQATKMALNPKHVECTSCHTGKGHRPTTNTGACVSCHEQEQKTAPKGHQACNKCHDSHNGKRIAAAASGCKGCHAAQATASQTLGHADCEKCHRAHGPKGAASPPTCTSCHQQGKLIGLHVTKGHETCTSCHKTPHVAARNDRASCIGCHPNEKDHKPDATVCSGCHRFSGQ